MSLLSRIGGYIANVGFIRGVGLMSHRLLGRFLSPGSYPAWGGLGEDALLGYYINEVLAIRDKGFYVDVGCNDPIRFSNTYFLYQMGWRGIAIDADRTLTETYREVRPRDTVVTALVSDSTADMSFHVFEESAVSTVDAVSAETLRSSGRRVVETCTLTPRTLDSILEEHGVSPDFCLLKVDVEGHDEAVLRSINLNRFRPRIIICEMHQVSVENVAESGVYKRLRDHHYRMVSLAGYNGIFIREEP